VHDPLRIVVDPARLFDTTFQSLRQ
jgi:hypothetical protein